MTHPPETLYDFVATLLCDGGARSDFAADPTGTLAGAGLQDITPQDVQEVVPLVLAYAPNGGLDSLEARLSELPSDPEAAVEHLQVVAQSAAEDQAMAPGSLTMGGGGGYDGDPFSSTLSGSGNLDGFTGEMASDSGLGTLTGDAWGSQESFGAAGTLGNDYGSGAAGFNGDRSGAESAMVTSSPFGSSVAGSQLSSDGAAGEFEAAGSEMDYGYEGHYGATPTRLHGGGSGDSPLGSISMHGSGSSDGFEFDGNGDPGQNLDGDTLAKGGEAAAGAMAGYVSSGGDTLASHINAGGDTLGAFLVGTARTTSDYIGTGAEYTAGHVSSGSDDFAGRIEQTPAHLQSPGDMSAPDAAELRSEVPSSSDLPNGGAPPELPNLPVENPLPAPAQPELPEAQQPSLNTVDEGVGNSPIGSSAPQDVPTSGAGDAATDLGMGG